MQSLYMNRATLLGVLWIFTAFAPTYASAQSIDDYLRDPDNFRVKSETVSVVQRGKTLGTDSSPVTQILTATVVRREVSYMWGIRDVWVPDCELVPGDGKGNWEGFFNVPKNQKADALARAIKGIGPSSAKKIVDADLILRKPKTWREFSDLITSIDRRLSLGISRNVLETYGKKNAENLGYFSAVDCTGGWKIEPREVLIEAENEVFEKSFTREVTVVFSRSTLLIGEEERVELSFNGRSVIVNPVSNYNSYQVSQTQTGSRRELVTLLSTGRLAAQVPNTVDVSVVNQNGAIALNIVDNAHDPSLGSDAGDLYVTVTFHTDGFINRQINNKRALAISMSKLRNTLFVTKVDPEKKRPSDRKKVFVKYTIHRKGSRFYRDAGSAERKSANQIF